MSNAEHPGLRTWMPAMWCGRSTNSLWPRRSMRRSRCKRRLVLWRP